MATDDDLRWMQRSLVLAARGSGETNPNPMVGCVIVKAGRVVGEGWHAWAGGPHAEVLALERAGSKARAGTLYVNLEPCAHRGLTPACAPRVAASGVRRVVAAMRDPNPLVSGRGFRLLERAGIRLTYGVLEAEALQLNARFATAAKLASRPFVLLKVATTLDGRIATASGDSKWITGRTERREARGLRRLHDAVLVGIGTVLADDPLLLPEPRTRRRVVRVVLDTRLRLPDASRLARSARRSTVWVLTASRNAARSRALAALGVRLIRVPARSGRLALGPALRRLRQLGLWSVIVEGGSEVLGSFLHARLFDELALFRAPILLGGRGSRPAFGGPDPSRIAKAVRLRRGETPRGGSYELWTRAGR